MQNLQGQGTPQLTESERKSLKDEIERLQHDIEWLELESKRYENEQRGLEIQKHSLKERFENTERRQQSIVSLLNQALQKRELSMNIVPQVEAHIRKRRLPKVGYFYDGAGIKDNLIGGLESELGEKVDSDSFLNLNLDQLEQLDASLTFWEDIVSDFSQSHFQISSNIELDESNSTGCAESPAISYVQLNVDIRPKSPDIDVNSDPVPTGASDPAASKEQSPKEQAIGPTPTLPTGVNDVFWEQFLTENPGSSDTQEVQSERKDSDGRRNESNPGDRSKFWWGMRNVNNITEQMGNLTPAERT